MAFDPCIHLDLSQHPEFWADNTEIDFGYGLYGKKVTGSLSSTTTRQYAVLITGANKIIKWGGYYDLGGTQLQLPWVDEGTANTVNFLNNSNGAQLAYKTSSSQTISYEVWILYTKS